MAEAVSRCYASAFCIERRPRGVNAVLKNDCRAWAENLATKRLWQAEKKGSAQGEQSVLLWPQRLSFKNDPKVRAVHERTLTSVQIASQLAEHALLHAVGRSSRLW